MPTITRTVLLLTLFSITTLFCFGQKQPNDSLKAVVTAIANNNVYEVSYTVGFAGTVSKQYLHFKQLLSLATEQQLTHLATLSKNAVVRLYSLQALRQKHASIPNSLLEQFQHDRTIVMTLNGCNGDKRTVSELMEKNLQFAVNFANK
jgi:hypothetical protein